MNLLDLIDQKPATARARETDPGTSHEAAASMTDPVLRKEQRKVLWALGQIDSHDHDGATAHELVLRLAYTGQAPQQSCVAKRCSELRDLGLICDSGETRPGGSGRRLIVWTLTNLGRGLGADTGGSDCGD